MTNESKLRDEMVTHRNCGAAEFLALAEELGIDAGAMVDPRTELSFAIARRKCRQCASKEKCRQALQQRIVTLGDVAPFCPSVDLLVELLRRQPYGCGRKPLLTSIEPGASIEQRRRAPG